MPDKPYNNHSKSDTIQVSQKDIEVFKVRLVGADRIHARNAFLTKDEELVLKDLKRKPRNPNDYLARTDAFSTLESLAYTLDSVIGAGDSAYANK